MFSSITDFITWLNATVSGIPLVVFIMVTGIYLTAKLNFLQFRYLGKAIKLIFKSDNSGDGEVSSFGSLCTALSATIGTGNIVGVATALAAGGPGALFWMIVAAFLGMATKYSEGLLAIKYRTVDSQNHVLGGPFYYIENGMGKNWKWLGKFFAFFGAGAGLLGIGTITQVNGISSAVQSFLDPKFVYTVEILGRTYSWSTIFTSIIVMVCAGLVLIGGIKRISNFAQVIVPFMAVFYFIFTFMIILMNITHLPSAIMTILKSAFSVKSVTGGFAGMAIVMALKSGISRGIFSNEAGLGSAPIAAAAAKTNNPVEQGLISMTGTFIDTIVICTLTGLTIVITDSWNVGLEGVNITIRAFQKGLPFPDAICSMILMFSLICFAFTTIIGWNYYGERCLEYLTNRNQKLVKLYRWLYILAVFIGPYIAVSAVWNIADIFNALMAFPNLIALLALSDIIVKETKKGLGKI